MKAFRLIVKAEGVPVGCLADEFPPIDAVTSVEIMNLARRVFAYHLPFYGGRTVNGAPFLGQRYILIRCPVNPASSSSRNISTRSARSHRLPIKHSSSEFSAQMSAHNPRKALRARASLISRKSTSPTVLRRSS